MKLLRLILKLRDLFLIKFIKNLGENMKKITPYFDDFAELLCKCPGCDDKLVIRVDKDKYIHGGNYSFYFEIQYDEPANLWQRILRAWSYIKGWRMPELSYDEIILDVGQVEELSKMLYKRVKKYRKAKGTCYKGSKNKEQ